MDNTEVLDFSLRKSIDSEETQRCPTDTEPELEKLQQQQQSQQQQQQQPQQRTGKRLQRMRPADEKLRAIERIRAGESKASVARDINVPESTIRGWCKSETAIRRCLQMKSPYDSEAYSPASSNGSVTETSHVADLPGLPGNSSDEENTPQREQRKSAKKQKIEASRVEAPHTPATPFRERGHVATPESDAKTSSELLWKWLMFNQRILNQQLIPLVPNGQMPDLKESAAATGMPLIQQVVPAETDKPRSADEAIAHGEKFLKWLEDCNDPSVTRFKVLQLKQLLGNLKASRK